MIQEKKKIFILIVIVSDDICGLIAQTWPGYGIGKSLDHAQIPD